MKVVFCWSDISGYMAACWRALGQIAGVDVKVIAYAPKAGASAAFAAEQVMHGINHRLLKPEEQNDTALIANLVRDEKPDAIVVTGWANKSYIALAYDQALSHARFVMGMDTPWRDEFRQRLARFALRRYLARVDAVVVAGERAWQYAIRLGISKDKIFRGIYAADYSLFSQAVELRSRGEWPRRFLYTGRYEHAKALDVLVKAYQVYRQSVSDPWPLTCCGLGRFGTLLRGVPGIEDRGFIQPTDQLQLLAEHGAFLLASRYEPWGVVLAEAGAAGLPMVCTEACGAGVELVRSAFNGFRVPSESPRHFASAMTWLHSHYDELPAMGAHAQAFAAAHDARVWAYHWSESILKANLTN